MRILHVLAKTGQGGVETWLMNVYRHIDRDRFRFDFLTQTAEPQYHDEEIRRLGGRVIHCWTPRQPLRYRRRLIRILKEEGPYDVIHAHGGNFMGIVLRYAAGAGIPVRIVHSHSLQHGLPRRLRSYVYQFFTRRWMFRYATVGLGCSSAAAAALFGPNWRSDKRFGVLLYGMDFSGFELPETARADRRKEFGIRPETPVVGHVGRFTPEKNHRFLIQVAAEVIRAMPEARFLLVGDGALRSQIEQDIRRAGLDEQIILTGMRSDVPSLLAAMDAYVFPSEFEGLGLSLVEAQAAGLRCVVSDVVPREADVLPARVRRLPLRAGVGAWAAAVRELLRMPRPDPQEARKALEASRFALTNTLAELIRTYETGRPPEEGQNG